MMMMMTTTTGRCKLPQRVRGGVQRRSGPGGPGSGPPGRVRGLWDSRKSGEKCARGGVGLRECPVDVTLASFGRPIHMHAVCSARLSLYSNHAQWWLLVAVADDYQVSILVMYRRCDSSRAWCDVSPAPRPDWGSLVHQVITLHATRSRLMQLGQCYRPFNKTENLQNDTWSQNELFSFIMCHTNETFMHICDKQPFYASLIWSLNFASGGFAPRPHRGSAPGPRWGLPSPATLWNRDPLATKTQLRHWRPGVNWLPLWFFYTVSRVLVLVYVQSNYGKSNGCSMYYIYRYCLIFLCDTKRFVSVRPTQLRLFDQYSVHSIRRWTKLYSLSILALFYSPVDFTDASHWCVHWCIELSTDERNQTTPWLINHTTWHLRYVA